MELDSLSISSAIEGVLQSLKEVIQQSGATHEPTPTEYFAVILATFSSGKDVDHVIPLLEIFHAVIPKTAPVVVRSQFKQILVCLLGLCKANTDNTKLIRLSITSLARCMQLCEVTDAFWRTKEAMHAFNALLRMLDDPKVKLRKAVQLELNNLLRVHKQAHGTYIRSYMADFCIEILKECKKSDYKRALHVIIFLEASAQNLIEKDAVRVCEQCLKVQECGQAVLSVEVFRMLDSFFQSPRLTLSGAQTARCVHLLFELKPRTSDMETNSYFCGALASGIACLHRADRAACGALAVQAVSCLVSRCELEFTQVHCAVGNAVKRIISACVDASMVTQAVAALPSTYTAKVGKNKRPKSGAPALQLIIDELCQLLQLRYQNAWIYVLDSLRSGLFEVVTGADKSVLLSPVILKLGDVFTAIESGQITGAQSGTQVALTDTLGGALKAVGLREFLSILPLVEPASEMRQAAGVASDIIAVDASRAWVFHTLRMHLKLIPNNKLADFMAKVIDPARKCNQNRLLRQNNLSAGEIALSKNSVNQLWSLLPELCNCAPVDIEQCFPSVNGMFLAALRDETYPELLAFITNATTNMIHSVTERYPMPIRRFVDASNMETMAACPLKTLHAQCGVYLPALMNMLETISTTDDRFPNLISCIAAWTSIASGSIIATMSKKILKLLLSTTTAVGDPSTNDAATCWMTAILAIIPFAPASIIQLLYRTIRPLLSVDENISLQKRAYRVLESLLKHHSEILFSTDISTEDTTDEPTVGDDLIQMQILDLITNSLLTCNVSARHMRLNCIQQLFVALSDNDAVVASDKILGEVLICQKDANKKSRDAALELLKAMVQKLDPQQLFVKLCSALVAETTVMRSSAVIAICMLLLEHQDDAAVVQYALELYPSLSMLLAENCVEQTRAFLQYTKVCCIVVHSKEQLEQLYPVIAHNMFNNIGKLKPKFMTRIRGIMRKVVTKVGTDESKIAAIRSYMPVPDQALLDYILKQTRKHEKQRQRVKSKRSRSTKNRTMIGTGYEDVLGSDSDDDSADGRDGDSDEDEDDEDAEAVDPRFPTRSKATHASHFVSHGHLPNSLDDLLADQSSSVMFQQTPSGRSSKVKSAAAVEGDKEEEEEEDGEKYSVEVNDEGMIVIKAKETKTAAPAVPLAAPKPVEMITGAAKGEGRFHQTETVRKRVRLPGEEYRAKKGTGGDVWRQGQLEPHAYIPLDGKMLSKKNVGSALQQYGAVVKSKKNAPGRKTAVATQKKEELKQARRDKRRAEENIGILNKHGLDVNTYGPQGSAQQQHKKARRGL